MIKLMHIELDSDKLYQRKFTTIDSLGEKTRISNYCCNCFLEEGYEFGCIKQTKEGFCECRLEHADSPIR